MSKEELVFKVARDNNISLDARGLYAGLMSYDVNFTLKQLSEMLGISNYILGKYLKELIDNGYCVKENDRYLVVGVKNE